MRTAPFDITGPIPENSYDFLTFTAGDASTGWMTLDTWINTVDEIMILGSISYGGTGVDTRVFVRTINFNSRIAT